MAEEKIRARSIFLDRYALDDTWYKTADRKSGRPGLIGGEDQSSGERVLVKYWPREPSSGKELRDLWAHEVRQLHRIAGSVGALRLICPLLEAVENRFGFYLILSVGQREPLARALESSMSSGWLNKVRRPRNRLIFWSNIRRVVQGVGILHSLGLLHRNLDSWSVFTDGGDHADFQLCGFEWSMRIFETHANRNKPSSPKNGSAYFSFLNDWLDLTQLICEVLQIKLGKQRAQIAGDLSFLTVPERVLVRKLAGLRPGHFIEATEIEEEIDRILEALESGGDAVTNELVIAFNLSQNSPLLVSLENADSAHSVSGGDEQSYLDFISADIGSSPTLAFRRNGKGSEPTPLLLGKNITYKLQAYHSRNLNITTWDVAYCGLAERYKPYPHEIVAKRVLRNPTLRLIGLAKAHNDFALFQGSTKKWDSLLHSEAGKNRELEKPLQETCESLVLMLAVQTLITEVQSFPVEIVNNKDDDGTASLLCLVPRRDEVRNHVSRSLGLDAPAKRMRDLFEEGDGELDSEWVISTDDPKVDENEYAPCRFLGVTRQNGKPVYRFEGDSPAFLGDELVLKPKDYAGGKIGNRRLARIVQASLEHEELLGILANSRIRIRSTRDRLDHERIDPKLDSDKKTALEHAWKSLPLYLIQGPPGVGKTRLVGEFVANSVELYDSRILLSAQSHHAVDHLLESVSKRIASTNPMSPLIVRCKKRSSDSVEESYDVTLLAQKIVRDFLRDGRSGELRPSLIGRLRDLDSVSSSPDPVSMSGQQVAAFRAIEALLLRSADLVFSTTNSGDLARLVDESATFDVSIVEEAAKATALELLTPLYLSHKRIAIGDHLQLPPFGGDQMRRIFSNSDGLKSAFDSGSALLLPLLRSSALEDLFEQLCALDSGEFASRAAKSGQLYHLFEQLATKEGHQPNSPTAGAFSKLRMQHRMHPSIAGLVSSAFYEKELQTHEECKTRFESSQRPFESTDRAQLPRSPIVFVDTPYVQNLVGGSQVEELPPYSNPSEVSAVVQILKCLVARSVETDGHPPSLAILTPYNEQVKVLKGEISANADSLKNLKSFSGEGGRYHVGTVDSFQGSEADVVLVSLVRNNHHFGHRALGFLSDSRRMNVLVSRAKWQLILVGSLDFLRSKAEDLCKKEEGSPHFLRLLLDTLEELRRSQLTAGEAECSYVQAPSVLEVG